MHDQAAAFVLDALDEDETAAFEWHLGACPACQAEVEPLRLAAAALAFAGELPAPPPRLRTRVLDVPCGVVVPLRRRRRELIFAAAAVAAACAALAVGLRLGGSGGTSIAGLRAYAVRGADGKLLVARDGEAVLLAPALPAPAAGAAYELWVVRRGRPLAAGFLHGPIGILTRAVGRGDGVAVSVEPTGGSRRPTGPLLIEAETA